MKNQFDFIFETDTCLSEKKRLAHDYKEQNSRLSYFDSLHNCMPNRNYLKVFGEELTHCSKPFTLLYLDVSDIKVINDTIGYEAADVWLKQTMEKLMGSINSTEKVFRWKDDAFVFIIEKTELLYIQKTAERLLNIVEESFEISGVKIRILGYIGAVAYPEDGMSLEELIRKASIAVRTSQIKGNRKFNYYDEKMSKKIIEKLEIEKDFEKALSEKEFFLCYQPVFDAQNNVL